MYEFALMRTSVGMVYSIIIWDLIPKFIQCDTLEEASAILTELDRHNYKQIF